ncbi:Sedlin [Melampsora americana]|nr:Sedlin [Melampsora americana]
MSYYFVIVGSNDKPIYQIDLITSKTSISSSVPPSKLKNHLIFSLFETFNSTSTNTNTNTNTSTSTSIESDPLTYPTKNSNQSRDVLELIVNASLDDLNHLIWNSKSMYFKNLDQFHQWSISALVPAGGIRLILLHEIKNEDGIRHFFLEVWELIVNIRLSPFYKPNSRIHSNQFDTKLKASARKHL